MVVVAVVDKQSVTETVHADGMAMTVVTTGTETELVNTADEATDDAALFELALTMAVTEADDEDC